MSLLFRDTRFVSILNSLDVIMGFVLMYKIHALRRHAEIPG